MAPHLLAKQLCSEAGDNGPRKTPLNVVDVLDCGPETVRSTGVPLTCVGGAN